MASLEARVDPRFFMSEDPIEAEIALEMIDLLRQRAQEAKEQETRQTLRKGLEGY